MAMTREVPLRRGECALLVIDMQRYCALPAVGIHKHIDQNNIPSNQKYLFDRIDKVTVPAIQKLLQAFRKSKANVIYTYIECLTKDCRDQSLDYKITGFKVPKGSPDAAIIDRLDPGEDDILIPKTSCSVFCSTNIEYVLRNLGVSQLVVTGIITNQCVESAVRDAADKGFLVTLVEEACAANSKEDHDNGLKNMHGFSRLSTTKEIIEELNQFS